MERSSADDLQKEGLCWSSTIEPYAGLVERAVGGMVTLHFPAVGERMQARTHDEDGPFNSLLFLS
jgi:hypothetical protein